MSQTQTSQTLAVSSKLNGLGWTLWTVGLAALALWFQNLQPPRSFTLKIGSIEGLSGVVRFKTSPTAPWRIATQKQEVFDGMSLSTDKQAKVLIHLNDGRRLSIGEESLVDLNLELRTLKNSFLVNVVEGQLKVFEDPSLPEPKSRSTGVRQWFQKTLSEINPISKQMNPLVLKSSSGQFEVPLKKATGDSLLKENQSESNLSFRVSESGESTVLVKGGTLLGGLTQGLKVTKLPDSALLEDSFLAQTTAEGNEKNEVNSPVGAEALKELDLPVSGSDFEDRLKPDENLDTKSASEERAELERAEAKVRAELERAKAKVRAELERAKTKERGEADLRNRGISWLGNLVFSNKLEWIWVRNSSEKNRFEWQVDCAKTCDLDLVKDVLRVQVALSNASSRTVETVKVREENDKLYVELSKTLLESGSQSIGSQTREAKAFQIHFLISDQAKSSQRFRVWDFPNSGWVFFGFKNSTTLNSKIKGSVSSPSAASTTSEFFSAGTIASPSQKSLWRNEVQSKFQKGAVGIALPIASIRKATSILESGEPLFTGHAQNINELLGSGNSTLLVSQNELTGCVFGSTAAPSQDTLSGIRQAFPGNALYTFKGGKVLSRNDFLGSLTKDTKGSYTLIFPPAEEFQPPVKLATQILQHPSFAGLALPSNFWVLSQSQLISWLKP